MKARLLEKLVEGNLRFNLFLRLVFIRMIKVVALCLALTFIVYLLWTGKFTLGSFLAGAMVGLVAFLTLGHLRRHLQRRESEEGAGETDESDNLTQSQETRPRSSVEQ